MTKRRRLYEEEHGHRRWLTESEKNRLFGVTDDEPKFEFKLPTIPKDKEVDMSWLDEKRKNFWKQLNNDIIDRYNKNNK